MLIRYLASLRPGMLVLWCYLIWYVVTVVNHFDPNPRLWLNSLGISGLIGAALVLSVGLEALRTAGPWAIVRLFLMPFCVSSFASLIKGKGFLLVIPPTGAEQAASFGACAAFLLLVAVIKGVTRPPRARPDASPEPSAI
jgi:hypothetical protein